MSYSRVVRTVFPDEDLAAIANAMVSDSEIILAPGVHVLTATIDINNKSRFAIRGSPGSVVRYPFAPGHPFQFTGNCEDILLEGFTIENSYVGTNSGECIQFQNGCNLKRIRFVNLTFLNSATGGSFEVLWTDGLMQLENIAFIGCDIALSHVYTGITFSMFDTGDQLTGLVIEDCHFRAPASYYGTGYMVSVRGSAGSIEDVVIRNNRFDGGSLASFVVLSGVYHGVIEGNIALNSRTSAIDTGSDTNHMVISGNVLIGNSGGSLTGLVDADSSTSTDIVVNANICGVSNWDAIRFGGTRGIASHNICYSTTRSAFAIYSGATNCLIIGNLIYSAGTNGHYTDGTVRIMIIGGIVDTTGSNGIYLSNAQYLNVIAVMVYLSTGRSIYVYNTSVRSSISDCFLTESAGTEDHINIASTASEISLTGNWLAASTMDGIDTNAPYTLMQHNYALMNGDESFQFRETADYSNCESNFSLGAGDNGIYIDSTYETNFSKNRIVGSVGDGIEETAGGDQNLYALNHVRGNTVALNLNGTNRTEYGNKT